MKNIATTLLLATAAASAGADGLKSLESFMKGTQRGRADFNQTVTSPAKDGQTARIQSSSGSFAFQRPGRFKFVYKKPFEQTIVADGQTLWIYDVDLNQVTRRAQAQALGSTPAALLASAPDLSALQSEFTLEAVPDQDGLHWVQASPRTPDGQIKSVRVGFAGEQLATLDILDGLGQRSVIRFTGMQANVALPANTFQFKPPAGADVVQQ
ncbi:outer membrane lipoprotein carrier protein LolA [Verminephrobacter aporrectodeae subsp. tuberculatae]|uniref:outer membrane lipoprotein chaperone LolA n=1 Tax=Verminephrobacter aporrectodeae TaxID=1110389 RepID=UPI002237A2A5|nr:outer membrane lipoprotein chaperone LolA [Verminephrobacter aporrectodeae]MCW5255378.1 outer membrane lipoprotein carrier protein LolA [Verminephrobacter aporrectodeae subsp. tuberculatae]